MGKLAADVGGKANDPSLVLVSSCPMTYPEDDDAFILPLYVDNSTVDDDVSSVPVATAFKAPWWPAPLPRSNASKNKLLAVGGIEVPFIIFGVDNR